MHKHLWINYGLSSSRDIAQQIKDAFPEAHLTVTHKDERPEITGLSDFAMGREPMKVSSEDYMAYMLNYIDQSRHNNAPISAILGGRFRKAMLENKTLFDKRGIRICAGSLSNEHLDLCEDKFAFTNFMMENGIPVATTIKVRSASEIAAAATALRRDGHIACIKPANGIYGAGFWVLMDDADDFDMLSDREHLTVRTDHYLRAFDKRKSDDAYIVMEHLPGLETSIDAVCDGGKMVSHSCRTKHPAYQEISTGGDIVEIAKTVAALLQLDGLVNIQFKQDVNGNNRILEVNTRAAGGFSYSSVAGIQLGADCLQMMHNEPVKQVLLETPVRVRPLTVPVRI